MLSRLKSLHPRVIDLSLGRIERLLGELGDPQRRLPPVVHVAGTNGKGSTVAMLRAILEAAGHRCHVYTSPHLVRFAERIVVAGHEIDEPSLIAALETCETANAGAPITYFEITTAAALLLFATRPADVVLLETGLGGRLDATNVVARPALTVLTAIDLDHQAFLGDTLAAIAGEKAGILKPGVRCISARQHTEAAPVIAARAAALGAPLLTEGDAWRLDATAGGITFAGFGLDLALPPPALPGDHQRRNAGLAIAAAVNIDALAVDPPALRHGLLTCRWPARLQRLADGRLQRLLPADWELWLDGGHNPAAAAVLAAHARGAWADRPLDLVIGMLRSKDAAGFLRPLAEVADRLVCVAVPGEDASADAADLAATAAGFGVPATTADSVDRAIATLADGRAEAPPRRLLICGSLYLAGRVLALDAS